MAFLCFWILELVWTGCLSMSDVSRRRCQGRFGGLRWLTKTEGRCVMRRIPETSLWLGHLGDSRDLRALLSAGILALVDLALEAPAAPVTRELVYLRFPIVDGGDNPPWVLRAAVEAVAALVRADVPAMVVCGAGMSRSPAIAAAALALARGLDAHAALVRVTGHAQPDVTPALWRDVLRCLDALRSAVPLHSRSSS